ncbi:MAG: HEAT repeat domain-containing protein [Hymenobacter sp.]|nr:HEAT repeat domain-containing protein [Hymenobacter sp.]
MKPIELLKKQALTEDWEQAREAAYELATIETEESFNFLVGLLALDNAQLRKIAALALREKADNRAVEPLLAAINNPANKNNRGTMVYALARLDCSHHLKNMFELLIYGNYEVKMGAVTVLEEQLFEFTIDELENIAAMWRDCKDHPEKCPGYEKCREGIESLIEGFLSYLK